MDKASKKNKKGRCALKQKGTQLASSAASPDIYNGWSHRHAMKRTRHVNITVKVTNWHARLHPKVCNSIGIAWVMRKNARWFLKSFFQILIHIEFADLVGT
jgi:hypothetical protein